MTAVDELVYLLGEAFSGRGIEETHESQSLLSNLMSVEESMWRTAPPGGVRTIESVALHVGSCKVMYDEYAFGPGRLDWQDAEVQPWIEEAPMAGTIAWLEEAHERFLRHVRVLHDPDLDVRRRTNWGESRETRWLISTIIQHDTYHAGEVNHIRALLSSNDAWRWS